MKTSVTFRTTFEASHQVPFDPDCGERVHGHSWFAEATIVGEPHAKSGAIATPADRFLWESVHELDHKHANDMLPGMFTTPEGIAHFVFERIQLECSGLKSVTVGFAGHSATVEV